MPYFQMSVGNATRTYKAHSAADVVAHHEKLGMNTYEERRIKELLESRPEWGTGPLCWFINDYKRKGNA